MCRGYEDEPGRRYPTVYVIQGYTAHYEMWRNRQPFRQPFPETADAVFRNGEAPPTKVVYVARARCPGPEAPGMTWCRRPSQAAGPCLSPTNQPRLSPVVCKAAAYEQCPKPQLEGNYCMDVVTRPGDRPRLLDLIDQTDGLRAVIEFDVIYSLADRPCQRCLEGRRQSVGESVALVKRQNAAHPLGHLITLCAEHAEKAQAGR